MAAEIRTIVESELDRYVGAVNRGFGADREEGELDRVREAIGLDRCHAAFDGERVVGTIGSYSFPLAVPGAVDVQAAGLTRVTVAATHRRQGILSSMMATHFDDARANGEAVSVLWASEVAIYGRFGYGPATEMLTLSFDARIAGITKPETLDTLDAIELDEAQKVIPDLRERTRIDRPGKFGRNETWWRLRVFADHEAWRDGASSLRAVVATRDGEPVGYALYRHRKRWDDLDLPDGEIVVTEAAGVDLQAQHTIWWHLANIDLFPRVRFHTESTDCLLPWLAGNSRAISRQHSDGIHLRVLDVETALSTRRYATTGELLFALDDPKQPQSTGTYLLAVDADGVGRCTRTDAAPTVTMSAYALGALYLGSVGTKPLAATGHIAAVSDDGQDLATVDGLFRWPVAAWCDEGF